MTALQILRWEYALCRKWRMSRYESVCMAIKAALRRKPF